MSTPRPGPMEERLGAPGRWAALAAQPLYAAAVAWRQGRFDRGIGVRRVPVPVVSIGNLSVGGTGKTPVVTWLVRRLLAQGRKPAIAMRGYVPRGAPVGATSDEAREYLDTLGDVPIVVNPDRFAGITDHLARHPGGFDVVVLDDGFQHRRLHRDVDLVLIDATRDPRADRLLPAGWLREPIENLTRADGVIVTHTESADARATAGLCASLSALTGAPVTEAAHEWCGLEGGPADAGPEWLRGRAVVAACAIGNPEPFLRAARALADVRHTLVLRDHAEYSARNVEALREAARRTGATAILTTGKDWPKLRNAPGAWPCPVVRPVLRIAFRRGEETIMDVVRRGLTAHASASGKSG